MKGDFTRLTFNSKNHFSRVLKQQGRVDLDADWNEQAALVEHRTRTLLVDLVGPHGGPEANLGFTVLAFTDPAVNATWKKQIAQAGLALAAGDFVLAAGRYYVQGLLCENEQLVLFSEQPEWRGTKLASEKTYLAYLDVWERHISYIEDEAIREVALNGPDTATRVRVTWQVKVLEAPSASTPVDEAQIAKLQAQLKELEATYQKLQKENPTQAKAIQTQITAIQNQIAELQKGAGSANAPTALPDCEQLLSGLRQRNRPQLRVRLKPEPTSTDPCVLSPDSKYRGVENQLYRVEIHRGSAATGEPPTFKWSRENGSVVTRWLGVDGNRVLVAHARGFQAGQWIEFTNEWDDLNEQPGTLQQITQVDGNALIVPNPPAWNEKLRHPKVRRWDQVATETQPLTDGAMPVNEGTGDQGWIGLEDGIEIQFVANTTQPADYRTGDYWQFPARVATGKIEWPTNGTEPAARPPFGIRHSYAPLGILQAGNSKQGVAILKNCQRKFAALAK